MFNFINNIGPTEIIFVALILVVLFGGKTIAGRLARTSGETVKEIKKIKRDFAEAIKDDDNEPSKD